MNPGKKIKESVLVTGGAGFIGSHVAGELLKQGYEVVVLDDLSGGFEDNVPPGATFLLGSILDAGLLAEAFERYKFDYVFHLAAYAAEGLSHFIKRFNYMNNLIGSVNLINESIRHEVKCFIFTSSIAVYGTNQLPMREDMVPLPEDPYGIAKLAVEQELRSSREMFGLNYVIFRPHNVYGEHQNTGDKYRNVIGIFIKNILEDKPVIIFGDGEQTRAFSYISGVAPFLAASIKNEKCFGQIFNIGSDKPYTVNQLADIVMRAIGKKAAKVYAPARQEVIHAYSDHGKLRKYFGEQTAVPLPEGIARMYEWVKKVGVRQSQGFENIEIHKNMPASWRELEGIRP